jgi:hypothetical protein
MAKTEKNSHPYIPSAGILVQTFSQLRKMFPSKVDAETLRKLSLAPKNESVVINALRFLGFIDDECRKTSLAGVVFNKHQDDAFAAELEKVVGAAYGDLFKTMGADAWSTDRSSLIGYFRVHDETSEITATRQAIAFETLASLSGHGALVQPKTSKPKAAIKSVPAKKKTAIQKSGPESETQTGSSGNGSVQLSNVGNNGVGLTVRIEINLPAQGDQETYDRIFQSIKQNLLNG